MARIPPAVRRVGATGVVFLAIWGLTGCSSNGSTPTVKAGEAAQTIGSVYALSPDQVSCLEKGFAAAPEATRPLASDGAASDDDLRALGEVENACIAPETLATAVVAGVRGGLGSLTSTQEACLSQAMAGLSDADRTTLLVGLAVNSALGDAQQAELGQVTNGLLTACQLAAGTQATPPTTP